jgi:5'-nucleotidase
LNVNIPNLPKDQLRGIAATRLGKRHVAEPVIKSQDPRGETIWWIGPAGEARDAGPGTDFYATAEGWVSVTPLNVDLTCRQSLPWVEDRLANPAAPAWNLQVE